MKRVVVIFLSLWLAGCELSNFSSDLYNIQTDSSADDDSENATPLSADFVIKDKFNQETTDFIVGEEITFEIIVTNTSDEDVTYQTTFPGYDFSVEQNSILIWSSSTGVSDTRDVTDQVIPASKVKVISVIWNGQNDWGGLVRPGTYQVIPHLDYTVDGNEVPDPEAMEITLQ